MTKIYKIVVSSKSCPAGPAHLKAKQADGSWKSVWSNTAGVPRLFKSPESAEKELDQMLTNNPDMVATVEEWTEKFWPNAPLAG